MDAAQIAVLTGGICLIAVILVFFFGGRKAEAAASVDAHGRQIIDVVVRGGYDPSVIEVKFGSPVLLRIYRDDTSSCSEEIVFPELGVSRFLPAHKTTEIELALPKKGQFEFSCGMHMLHGKLVVV